MDCAKTGKLIFSLRKEKNMTQKQLADALNLSDRTISKWERGIGCPDVSLLSELSEILGVNIEKILAGELMQNDKNGGNMKRSNFYACPGCGNILFSTGVGDFSCCGRKLNPLKVMPEDENHPIKVEEIEFDYYITINHEMSKSHYISFAAQVTCNRVLLTKLYPEQNAEMRFPKMPDSKLYICCNNHGLFEKKI